MKLLKSTATLCTLVAPVVFAWVCATLAAPARTPATQQHQSSLGRSSQNPTPPATSGAGISGRVLAADNSKPLKGARVALTAPELPRGRSVLTDDQGVYRITGLPAGTYTIIASKAGFLDLVYGQRRPLMEGEVVGLDVGEHYPFTDCKMLRAGAIAGRIADESGEPLAGATVGLMQYQRIKDERRLVHAGTAQTDDTGSYRVWGLMPGDYYVRVTAPGLGTQHKGESAGSTPTYFPGVGSITEAKAVTLGISKVVLDINFGIR
jgi:uncharacterized surface anchored protein